MSLTLYLTFIFLICITGYYFIYLKKLNVDNLFTIILNFVFLTILPLYYFYFKDYFLSMIVTILLLISAFILNIKFNIFFIKINIPYLIYYCLTSIIFGYVLFSIP